MSTINKEDFIQWKNNPITKEVFKTLEEIKENIKKGLTSPDLIMSPQSDKVSCRLLGQLDSLDIILEMSIDELIDQDEVEQIIQTLS